MFQKLFVLLTLLFIFNIPAYASELSCVEIHGFASTGYIISDKYNYMADSKEGTCEFNEAGINFNASIADDIQVGMQLYSYDLGDVGNNEIKVDWALVDYSWKEALGIRLGKFKTPLALYTDVLDYDMLFTPAILPQGIYNQYYREGIKSVQGADVYGQINMGIPGIIGYHFFYGSINIDKEGSLAKMFTGENGFMEYGKVENLIGTRIKWNTFIKGLVFVTSYLQSDFSYEIVTPGVISTIDYSQSSLRILSAEYSIGNLTAFFEYQKSIGDISIEVDMSSISMPVIKDQNEVDVDTYYGQLSYRFCKWFETGAYYSVNNADRLEQSDDAPDYADWQHDMALCARFDINDFWIMKFEIHHINGVSQVLDHLEPEDYKGKHWTAFAYKTTFSF
jgi:hypothetical protein